MHLVIAPAAFIQLAIVCLEYSLALSDPLPMLSLVLVPCQIKGKAEAVTRALIEHSLVAEPVLEKHVADAVHLTLRVNLAIIDIAVIDTLGSIDSLNYRI